MTFVRACKVKLFAARISLLLCLSVITSMPAAEHLEIRVNLKSTWRSQTKTNEHETTAICVLGPNDWYISGQFLKNAYVEYWLRGTNIIEHKVITSSMYLKQAKDFISEKIGAKPRRTPIVRYPTKGESSMRTNSWLEPFGYGVERAIWLAYCSGRFLRTPSRQVPLPIGHFSDVQRYTDKTILLESESSLSPPKYMELSTSNGRLACSYAALASTNVLGHSFPLEFRLFQHGNPGQRWVGTNMSHTVVLGKVISIKPCEEPAVPEMESTLQK